jgi:hypothetical protein
MEAAGAVALLTPDIPLGHGMGLEVVVHGMATVAGGAGGAVEVGGAVVRNPPIGTSLNVVGEPTAFLHIPLGRKGVEVVPAAREVALLEPAAIGEGHVIEGEGPEGIGVREVTDYCFGVDPGIEEDIGHAALLPAFVSLEVAWFAAF